MPIVPNHALQQTAAAIWDFFRNTPELMLKITTLPSKTIHRTRTRHAAELSRSATTSSHPTSTGLRQS